MDAWPPCRQFHSTEVLPEFVVWSEDPAGTWLQLLRFFTGELLATGPGGCWLQADSCCSRASWVAVLLSAAGNIALARFEDGGGSSCRRAPVKCEEGSG